MGAARARCAHFYTSHQELSHICWMNVASGPPHAALVFTASESVETSTSSLPM